MSSTKTDSTRPMLLVQTDWPQWFEFIRKQANFAKIWDYVDPNKNEDEIKVNTEPQIPTTSTVTTTSNTPQPTGSNTPATQTVTTSINQYELYKIQRLDYLKREEKLQTFAELVVATVGSNFSAYLKDKLTPYEMIKELKDVAKPSQATLRKLVKDDMKKRNQGPKRQSIETWLQLHITIIQRGKELDKALPGADEESVIQAFIEDCEEICPLLYNTYGHQVLAESHELKMSKLISEFNLLYKPSGRHAHAATLSGQPVEDSATSNTPSTPTPTTGHSNTKCHACGLLHKVKNCKQLFKALRGPNFVANDEALKRCAEWLKVPANRQYYEKRLKQIEKEAKSTPTPSTQDDVEDLSKPNVTAAATVASFHDQPDLSLLDVWGYDTMADTHICNDIKYFRSFEPTKATATAGDNGAEIHGYGDVLLAIEVGKQRLIRHLTLKNVAYAPYFHINLVCAAKLRKVGVIMDQATNHLRYKDDGSLFANLTERGDLYLIDATAVPPPSTTACAVSSKKHFKATAYDRVWHQRLGHCDLEAIKHLPKAVEGVNVTKTDGGRTPYGPPLCEPCVLGKMTQQSSRRPSAKGTYPFERVHFDVIMEEEAFNGDTCVAHFWCDYTKYHRAFPIKNHKQKTLLPLFESVMAFAKKFDSRGVRVWHMDDEQGVGKKIANLILRDGAVVEQSTPYTPDQNGAAERSGRAISERARTLLMEANLPKHLWCEFVLAAVYLLNRTPCESIDWKTPFEMLYKRKPWLTGLRILGSLVYVLVKHGIPKLDKFEPKAQLGYLVGIEASNIYRIWMPMTNRVIRSRDVRIDETVRYKPPTTATHLLVSEAEKERLQRIQDLLDVLHKDSSEWIECFDEVLDAGPSPVTNIDLRPTSKDIQDRLITRHEPQQLITPERTPEQPALPDTETEASPSRAPAPPEVPPPEEPEPDIPGPSSGGERRSGRDKRPTAKAKDMPNKDLRRRAYATQVEDDNDIIDPDSNPMAHAFYNATNRTYGHRDDAPPRPKSWKEMLNHKYAAEFKAAAHTEIRALLSKHTWDEVRLSKKVQHLPTMWTFLYKEDEDGFITRFKARLVVRGDLQAIPHEEVKAITAAYRTFRLLCALIAAFDLEVTQTDAVNAFVNAMIGEEVYLSTPEGLDLPPDVSLRLRKAMYGLRKSPKLWFLEMTATLKAIGLAPVPDEPCLFVHPNKPVFVFFYVDDILVISHTTCRDEGEDIRKRLHERFEMRRMPQFSSFLSTRVIRDREKRKLWLCQDQYLEKLVTLYQLEYMKPSATPLSGQVLTKYDGEATPNQAKGYQRRVGSVTYPASTLRPDVAHAASTLAQFMHNPSPAHLAEANRTIVYLYDTRFLAIEFSANTPYQMQQVLKAASDASYADDAETRRSTQGYLIKLFNGPIAWQSTRQKTVTTSTTEAELLALSNVGREVEHMTRIFKAIRFDPDHKVTLDCDNKQTVRIVSNETPTISTRLRHVDIHQFWLRQEVQNGKFAVQWVPTGEMPADGLTKPLSKQNHQSFVEMLGLHDIKHLIN